MPHLKLCLHRISVHLFLCLLRYLSDWVNCQRLSTSEPRLSGRSYLGEKNLKRFPSDTSAIQGKTESTFISEGSAITFVLFVRVLFLLLFWPRPLKLLENVARLLGIILTSKLMVGFIFTLGKKREQSWHTINRTTSTKRFRNRIRSEFIDQFRLVGLNFVSCRFVSFRRIQ